MRQSPPHTPQRMRPTVTLFAALLLVLGGCQAFEVDDERGNGDAPGQESGPRTATIGTPILVDGLEITVEDAKYAEGFQYQDPAAGHVFVGYEVRLRAVDGDHLVTSADFTASADGRRQGRSTIVVADDWEPTLNFEDLKEGNEISGWVVFEVPEPDEYIALSYESSVFSDGPDVVLRTRCCN